MADLGIWGLGHLLAPAATDRLPLESGVGAGGHSTRGEFVWRDASGKYNCAGSLGINVSPAFPLHVKASSEIARFETTTARGSGDGYIGIADPSGRKGYIGYGGANDTFDIANSMNANMVFYTNNTARWVISAAGTLYAASDNAYAICGPSNRATAVYAVTGSIQTSDASQKTWRGSAIEAELAAARRIIAELGFFQWNDAIAEKGPDDARYHFGVRAQEVWAIMADEGLIDPIEEDVAPNSKYAFLCWDPLEEDDTVGRFGIRPDQLALFLIAAQEARILALENLITEGE